MIAVGTLVALIHSPSWAGEEKKKKTEEGLEEEWVLQEDADYPDLVGVDDESEVMDEFAFLQEEDIVLTAAKHKQKAGFSPSAVIVITRKDIEESGASSLVELLRRYAGMHVYLIDPLFPALMIRDTIRVLMLIDNREVNLELFVAPFYEMIPVGLEDIERIEIVLGPNSALYGANAVSAVLNIQTRRPETGFHTRLSVAAGEHGTTRVGGTLGGGVGPLALQGTVRLERANSWMDRGILAEDLVKSRFTAQLKLGDLTLTADGGLVAGGGRIYGVMGNMDFSKLVLPHARVELDHPDFKARAYWYGFRGSFDMDLKLFHPETGVDLGSTPVFHGSVDTFQADGQYDVSLFENNLLIAGADFRLVRMHSEQMVDPDLLEYRFGVFLHDEHRFLKRLLLTLGARLDWNSVTDPAVSPRAALVYNPAGEHFLRLSGAMAFRKPIMLESSMNFRIDTTFPEMKTVFEEKGISNPDLENEILTGFELGYRGALLERALRLGADVYLNLNRNWISFKSDIRFGDYGRIDLEKTNIGYRNSDDDFNVFGVSFFVEGEPLPELTLFLRGEIRHEWFLQKSTLTGKTPPYLGSAGGTLRLPFGLTAHLAVVHVSGRKDDVRDPRSALEPAIWQNLAPVTWFLAVLGWRLELGQSRVELGLSLFNPFGRPRREKAGLRAPDGSNYGGELIGTRAMATARFQY